jgi:hypothetical protein
MGAPTLRARALLSALIAPGEPEREEEALSPRARAALLGAVVMVAVTLRLWMALTTELTETAALITLRMSEHLAHGQGFVYNAGEHVLGTTAPLYAMILALGIKAGLPGLAFGKGLTIVADASLCVAVYTWLRTLGQERAGRLAALLVALSPRLVHWSISGMGMSLVTLGAICTWIAFARGRYRAAYAILGLLFIARWDSLVLTLAFSLAVTFRQRRLPLGGLAVFALVVAPWVAFATWYFGSPIPVTWAAKTAVQSRVLGPAIAPYWRELIHLFVASAWDALLSLAAFVGLLRVLARRRTAFFPALVWYGVFWGVFLLSRAAPSDRYALSSYPIYLGLAAIAVVALADRLSALAPRAERWVLPALAGAAALLALTALLPEQRRLASHQAYEQSVRAPVGRWLGVHGDPHDRVLVTSQSSIGYFGYYSGLAMIDPKGLVTPTALPFWQKSYAYPDLAIARAFLPEWCVVRHDELPVLERMASSSGRAWDDDYALALSFPTAERPVYHVFRRRRP